MYNHNAETRAQEAKILIEKIDGYDCEVVRIDGEILLYVDGYFMGELYEEEAPEEYIEQIKSIL